MRPIKLGGFTIKHSHNEIIEVWVRLIAMQTPLNYPCRFCPSPNASSHNIMFAWNGITIREEDEHWVEVNRKNPETGVAHITCVNRIVMNGTPSPTRSSIKRVLSPRDTWIARGIWDLARQKIIDKKRHRGRKNIYRNAILRDIILGVAE